MLITIKPKPLSEVKAEKIAQIEAAYIAAMQQPVTYMGTTFQADAASQDILTKTLVTLNATGSVPAAFWWRDANNNNVAMSLAELNGLAGAMLNQGWAAFQQRVERKDVVTAATSTAEVDAVAPAQVV